MIYCYMLGPDILTCLIKESKLLNKTYIFWLILYICILTLMKITLIVLSSLTIFIQVGFLIKMSLTLY